MRPAEQFVAGLVLAAGGSSRLGEPKQLLSVEGRTLLDHSLDTARACKFDQLVVVLGGGSEEIRRSVNLGDALVVENTRFGDGCSSSIAAGLRAVETACDVLVLLLGDQPGVRAHTVERLLAGRGDAPMGVCRYQDGRGHPLCFARTLFPRLAALQGDKAVWKLMEADPAAVTEVSVDGRVPLDVDTWADYQALVAGYQPNARGAA